MSSFCKCKSYSHFFSRNISVYAIFNDQSFNDTLTNDIVSIEQLGPEVIWAYMITVLKFYTQKFLTKGQKQLRLPEFDIRAQLFKTNDVVS